jgi:glycosyltransferase involved in cell wall biosynthesis
VPVVTVVTVFHQPSPHLPAAIASVRAQTLRDWELILVDNGTGLGRSVLGSDAAADERIRIVPLSTNEGIARGIAAGVRAAKSEFIALLDYDDVALPRRLERQVEMLRADPSLGLVNCGVDTIDDNGRVTGREFSLLDGAAQRCFSAYATPVVSPVYTGRREVFAQFPHREAFRWGSDFDFFNRVVEQWKVSGVGEVLQQYRRYAGQTTVLREAGLVLNQCAIRLLTARRRAGRPEELETLAAEMARLENAAPAEIYRHFARQCLAEGWTTPAVYHARRLLAVSRTPAAFLTAGRIFIGTLWRNPGRALFLTRLFFSGPLRTHGLRNEASELS